MIAAAIGLSLLYASRIVFPGVGCIRCPSPDRSVSDEEVTGKLHTQSVALAENDTAPVRRMLRNGGSRAVYVSGMGKDAG